MKIFVIGGKARSGKDTFSTYLKEELEQRGFRPCIMHITEPLYAYARNYFGWRETDAKPRRFLQTMGIEVIRERLGKKDFLLRRLYEDIEILECFFDTFIISDARMKDEFLAIKGKYDDVISIKIERGEDNSLSAEEKTHITETEIEEINDFDFVIENINKDYLKDKAKDVILNCCKEEV